MDELETDYPGLVFVNLITFASILCFVEYVPRRRKFAHFPRHADVCAKEGDIFQALAIKINLDYADIDKWLQPPPAGKPQPKAGDQFTIPNTVYFDLGPTTLKGKILREATWDSLYNWSKEEADKFHKKKYRVIRTDNIMDADVMKKHLKDKDLAAYIWTGHGSLGSLQPGYGPKSKVVGPGGGKGQVDPGRWTHHRIEFLGLYACATMSTGTMPVLKRFIDEKKTNKQNRERFTLWHLNVSEQGRVVGFTKNVTIGFFTNDAGDYYQESGNVVWKSEKLRQEYEKSYRMK